MLFIQLYVSAVLFFTALCQIMTIIILSDLSSLTMDKLMVYGSA